MTETSSITLTTPALPADTVISLGQLQTEQRNPNSTKIDEVSSLELCRIINHEDATVAGAVQKCLPEIAAAIDAIVPKIAAGGRVIYTGAGTSGVLDASEIPPTFSAPPGQFVGLIAGGDHAIRHAVEGSEDSEEVGKADLCRLDPPLGRGDVLVGIASSGRTPYVLGGLEHARSVGAVTVGLACVKPSALGRFCDVLIECVTGPEVVTGSTRLKAGTATKMILNMISTGSEIRIGKTFGNLMVDLQISNEKLRDRAHRVLQSATPSTSALDVSNHQLRDEILNRCDGQVKLGILIATLGCSPEEGRRRLEFASGNLKGAMRSQS